jgi:2-hydroxychromene-2-carboxylate isomerase
MRLRGWLAGSIMSNMADLQAQQRRERRAEKKRRGLPLLHFFYQADDPYSHLLAQILPGLLDQFHLQCIFHLVPPGHDEMLPERQMQGVHARRDAAAVAPWYGLHFEDRSHPPRQELLSIAQCILSLPRNIIDPGLPNQVGHALWQDDAIALQALAERYGFSDVATSHKALLAGDRERSRFGHYLGGTLHFEGTCYYGIDRVHYLQTRLVARGLLRVERDALSMILPKRKSVASAVEQASVVTGSDLTFGHATAPAVLEFFASLRSPYTWLAMARVMALCQRYRLHVVLRPVLPMVMRGLPVPRQKGAYIMMDCAREAKVLGIDFGKVCDPLGKPVERALSLFDWVRRQGQELAYFHALLRAAFAEGRDIHAKATLRSIIESLGLDWQQALSLLDNHDWQDEIEQNRLDMEAVQCWGVPSFILRHPGQQQPLCVAWGQDRLWLIEEILLQSGCAVAAEVTGGG